MAQLLVAFNAGECNAHCKSMGYERGLLMKDKITCFCGDAFPLKELNEKILVSSSVHTGAFSSTGSDEW